MPSSFFVIFERPARTLSFFHDDVAFGIDHPARSKARKNAPTVSDGVAGSRRGPIAERKRRPLWQASAALQECIGGSRASAFGGAPGRIHLLNIDAGMLLHQIDSRARAP